VRVVHRPNPDSGTDGQSDERRVLASEVETAEGIVSRGLGLMFRRSLPDDYALVFRFDAQRRRNLHMVFVPFDIDALWLSDGVVQRAETLRAWLGHGSAVADTVIELPAGAADGVTARDRVVVEG